MPDTNAKDSFDLSESLLSAVYYQSSLAYLLCEVVVRRVIPLRNAGGDSAISQR
jgi:hypothetical protein